MTTTFREMKEVLESEPKVYGGPWRAMVEEREDEEKSGRIKARIEPLHGKHPKAGGTIPTEDLKWAYPMQRTVAPSNRPKIEEEDYGSFSVPYVGSWVWMWFDRGDPQVPLYMPGVREKDNVPPRFLGKEDKAHKTIKKNVVDDKFTEKEGKLGEYPKSVGWVMKSGIVVEYDDSSDPRIFKFHPSGWWEQVDSDGNKNEHTPGNNQNVVIGNRETHTKGNRTNLIIGEKTEEIRGKETRLILSDVSETIQAKEAKEVTGDRDLTVGGNLTRETGGNEEVTIGGNKKSNLSGNETVTIGGNKTVTIGGNATEQVSASKTIQSGGAVTIKAGGTIKLEAPTIVLKGAVTMGP